jgi:hypothetical protein
MVRSLVFSAATYDSLMDHVNQAGTEQVAFLLTMDVGDELEVTNLFPAPPSWFDVQSGYHVSLKDEVRAKVIKWAWDHGAGLAEAHSHLGDAPASFSPTDIAGLEEWAPHVRWRLAGRPYVALVFAGAGFDALAWSKDDADPTGLDAIRLDDGREFVPTGRTIRALGRHMRDGQ